MLTWTIASESGASSFEEGEESKEDVRSSVYS